MIAETPDQELELSMEERIMRAFEKDFHKKFPQHVLGPVFSNMIQYYVELTSGIATTNLVEQIIEFLKVCEQCDNQVPVNMLIKYLKETNFSYKQTKTQANGRFKKVH